MQVHAVNYPAKPSSCLLMIGYLIYLLSFSGCTAPDPFVDLKAPTVSNASQKDFYGVWINASQISDEFAWVQVYELLPDGTGKRVAMNLHGKNRTVAEFSANWEQTSEGRIVIRHQKISGDGVVFGNETTARLTANGLEMTQNNLTGGHFHHQYFHPEDPQLAKMVTEMHRQHDKYEQDNLLGQIFGQVVTAALSSTISTLANNPAASASELRYQAAKGVLESFQ